MSDDIKRYNLTATGFQAWPPPPTALGNCVLYSDHSDAIAERDKELEKLRAMEWAYQEQIKKLRTLYDAAWAECDIARVCVEADPIYGWEEPRICDSGDQNWHDLGSERSAHDAARRAAGETG